MKSLFALLCIGSVFAGCVRSSSVGSAQAALEANDGGADAAVVDASVPDLGPGGIGTPCNSDRDCFMTIVCSPNSNGGEDCVGTLHCPICGDGNTCTVDGVCDGPVCGGGNVVCNPLYVCALDGNCVPPCRDNVTDEVIYEGVWGCEGVGELTAADGRCFIPEWYPLCRRSGGH